MRAIRVHAFGGVEAMVYELLPRPVPGPGQVLIRVAAAGVGLWDCWVRSGHSLLPQPLPLTPGADLSGTIEEVGSGVTNFPMGADVFGVTNPRFVGAYAEYALAEATMVARRPLTLSHLEAASVPVIGCTALQMLFDEAGVQAGQTVVVLGGAGNVGAYAVKLARIAGAKVIATGRAHHRERLERLGAIAIDSDAPFPAALVGQADAVIDTVGGDAQAQGFQALRVGGILVSAVAQPDPGAAARHQVQARVMLVRVTAAKLQRLADLLAAGQLQAHVGQVLKLSEARLAHTLLEGGKAPPGKLVLTPDGFPEACADGDARPRSSPTDALSPESFKE